MGDHPQPAGRGGRGGRQPDRRRRGPGRLGGSARLGSASGAGRGAMTFFNSRWAHVPSEMSEGAPRRADELYEIDDAPVDERGLIECAVLPLRDVVLFPNMVTPLFIGLESPVAAVEEAVHTRLTMIAVTQLDPELEEPTPADLYPGGTASAAGRLVRMPDGTTSVLTQGRRHL